MPSQVEYHLHQLKIALTACVEITSLDHLTTLGLNAASFGRLSYAERSLEYPRTQEIAEAAHFHGRDGLLVPSARSPHPNLVVFCDPAGPASLHLVKSHGPIDWDAWRKNPTQLTPPSPSAETSRSKPNSR